MEPICLKILEAWAKYTNYDENRTRFSLSSYYDYEFHKATKKISHIVDDYDESGIIAVITVKELFNKVLKQAKPDCSYYDILENPNIFDEAREMFEMFRSKEFVDMEKQYATTLNKLLEQVVGRKLLSDGSGHDEGIATENIFYYTDRVVNSLDKCHVEVYKKSALPVGPFKHFSTKINVFPSLAACLLTLDKAPDGIYLCYIDISQSADSYFGFFMKSNGNLLSFNERVKEAFRGQHANGRNARWTEAKADEIFPYDFIFNYGKHDYKGYATAYSIDESKLSFFELTEDVYLPLLLGMIFTARKFDKKTLEDYPLIYTDALLTVNMPLISSDKNELMVISKNELVTQTNAIDVSFDYDKIMSGEVFDEFKESGKLRSQNNGQIFVDLYGEGFVPGPALDTGTYLATTNSDYAAEVIGTEEDLRIQACQDIRKQLADYIKKKMNEEYDAYGGDKAVAKWFEDTIKSKADEIKDFAVQAYIDVKTGKKHGHGGTAFIIPAGDYCVKVEESKRPVYCGEWGCVSLNKFDRKTGKWFDMDTDAACNIAVTIYPADYTAIEKILGVEVPKIVKGWERHPKGVSVNPNLDAYDLVERIYTPFNFKSSINFGFTVGFAKRGLAMNAKRLGYDINNLQPVPEEERDNSSPAICVLGM